MAVVQLEELSLTAESSEVDFGHSRFIGSLTLHEESNEKSVDSDNSCRGYHWMGQAILVCYQWEPQARTTIKTLSFATCHTILHRYKKAHYMSK